MRLTEQQKNDYVTGGYSKCPACLSENIEGGAVDIDANIATQPMNCTECGRHWTDVFRLVSIVED